VKIAFKYVNEWGCAEMWYLAVCAAASAWRGNDTFTVIFLTGLMVLVGVRKSVRKDTP
jgi:hypothetical protein